ncbi:hypothetical protein ABV409_16385 [Flagellimonas sp. DF-77]|uniref:hypothetical protein n=1 Tax=Flagellimonas algarum TaxID=3230298 RepID=UPI003391292A
MDEHQNKDLNGLVDKFMVEAPLERPSADFTEKLMAKVAMLPKKGLIAYKPLLSNKLKIIWGLVFVLLLAGLVPMVDAAAEGHVYGALAKSYLKSVSAYLPSFEWSKSYVYGFVFMAVMVLIQVGYLKRFFENRIA